MLLDSCWKRARSLTASTWFRTASFLVPCRSPAVSIWARFGYAHAGGISECERHRKASKRFLGLSDGRDPGDVLHARVAYKMSLASRLSAVLGVGACVGIEGVLAAQRALLPAARAHETDWSTQAARHTAPICFRWIAQCRALASRCRCHLEASL